MSDVKITDFSNWTAFKQTPWYSFYEKDNWCAVGISGSRSGACLLVVDSTDHVLLVRSYRIALDMECLEIPRGFSDEGETYAACAARECVEETGVGLKPDELSDLGVIYPDSGILSSQIGLFAAELDVPFGEIKIDPNEISGYEIVSLRQLEDMIADGRMNDAMTISAYMRFMRMRADRLRTVGGSGLNHFAYF